MFVFTKVITDSSLGPHTLRPNYFRNVLILMTEESDIESRYGEDFSLRRRDRLWGPPSLLADG
jgi:hypothetical protein